MRLIHPALIAVLLLAWPHQASAAEWKPPAGLAWHTNCVLPKNSTAYMQGCYFGAQGSTEHTGLVFFRVCGAYREARPFLIVDFRSNSYVFDRDGKGETRRGTLSSDDSSSTASSSIDPVPFFHEMEEWRGSCRFEGSHI